jgi:hypothetical protein
MAQYLSNLRPQLSNNTFAVPPPIGVVSPNSGTFTVLSAQQLRLSIKTVSSNYTVAVDDCVLLCNATDGEVVISLPNPANYPGRSINIKKIDASENKVVLLPLFATVDAKATYDVKYSMESIVVISNGSNYFVL